MYTGAAACNKIGAPGKGIRRPPDDFQYTVFVQNKSRGSRCLLEGTILLYKKNVCAQLFYCSNISSLGHLKKIISFSSSWLRNLNAAGGNLILSIYCASYIQTT